MYPSNSTEWLSYLLYTGTEAFRPAMVFLCLWLWLGRRDLSTALKRALPGSLRFNFLSLVLDTTLVAIPLEHLAEATQHLLRSNGLVLFGGIEMTHAPGLVVAALAVFLGDLVAYFRHRLEHSAVLWPGHVMHHSDAHMTWATVYRFHPINRLTTVIIDYGALVALGFPPWAVVASGLFRHYYGMFIHAEVPWTYGWLGRYLVSPAMHRWHHVMEGEGVGSNFGSVFAVFDRAFGTYHLPGPCHKPLGVPDIDNDAFLRQLVHPTQVFAAAAFRRFKARRLGAEVRSVKNSTPA